MFFFRNSLFFPPFHLLPFSLSLWTPSGSSNEGLVCSGKGQSAGLEAAERPKKRRKLEGGGEGDWKNQAEKRIFRGPSSRCFLLSSSHARDSAGLFRQGSLACSEEGAIGAFSRSVFSFALALFLFSRPFFPLTSFSFLFLLLPPPPPTTPKHQATSPASAGPQSSTPSSSGPSTPWEAPRRPRRRRSSGG